MTPQLQQAIKLLQLSRMELVDLVHDEMIENPILDDGSRLGQERGKDEPDGEGGDDLQGETELAAARRRERPSTAPRSRRPRSRATPQAVNEIDWENYLDNYSIGPPMPAFRAEQRGAAVARGDADQARPRSTTTSRGSSSMSHLPAERRERRHARSSATSTPTATSRTRRSPSSPPTSASPASSPRRCSRSSRPSTRSASARASRRVPADPGAPCRRRRRRPRRQDDHRATSATSRRRTTRRSRAT